MSKNTMTVRDVSLLVTSLHYRASSLNELALGIRSGARTGGRFITLTPNLTLKMEAIAKQEHTLAVQLDQLLANISVEIDV